MNVAVACAAGSVVVLTAMRSTGRDGHNRISILCRSYVSECTPEGIPAMISTATQIPHRVDRNRMFYTIQP